jgi:hypothetical protein
MRLLALVAALAGGCFSPSYENGTLQCSSDGLCPRGFHCAADRTCWQDGTDPTLDLAPGADAAVPDLSTPPDQLMSDLVTPPDLSPILYPPAAVWLSSGGGPATSNNSAQVGLSIGGTDVVGDLTGSSGGQCAFGYLFNGAF